jgi:hypothetical protein
MVTYSYGTPGVTFYQNHGLEWAIWSRLHPGDALPVKYLADEPGNSRIDLPEEDADERNSVLILGAIGIVATGISIYSFSRR